MERNERQKLAQDYGNGFEILERAWESAPEESRHWKPSPNDWSAHEIIIHCADSETYAATRIRLLVAEPAPTIVGYNQERWVTTFDYERLPAELALAAIAAVRANTFYLIRQFDDREWASIGTHTESGSYSAGDWLRTYAIHLHDHADQIRSNVEKWKSLG